MLMGTGTEKGTVGADPSQPARAARRVPSWRGSARAATQPAPAPSRFSHAPIQSAAASREAAAVLVVTHLPGSPRHLKSMEAWGTRTGTPLTWVRVWGWVCWVPRAVSLEGWTRPCGRAGRRRGAHKQARPRTAGGGSGVELALRAAPAGQAIPHRDSQPLASWTKTLQSGRISEADTVQPPERD